MQNLAGIIEINDAKTGEILNFHIPKENGAFIRANEKQQPLYLT